MTFEDGVRIVQTREDAGCVYHCQTRQVFSGHPSVSIETPLSCRVWQTVLVECETSLLTDVCQLYSNAETV